MNRKQCIIILSLLTCVSLFMGGMSTFAAEDAGGQVGTGGKITFYEEEVTEPSKTLPDTDGSTAPLEEENNSIGPIMNDATASNETVKPVGKIPSLGEVAEKYGLIGFGLVVFGLLLFFVRRRIKEEQS